MHALVDKMVLRSMTVSFTLGEAHLPFINISHHVVSNIDMVVYTDTTKHSFMHKTDTNTSTQRSYVARCAVMGGRDYPNRVLVTT